MKTLLILLIMAVGVQPVFAGELTDSRDGKRYKTVKIGSQTWMAQNLDYAAGGSKCYEDNSNNCKIYGRLYNWATALRTCPSGWHLSSDDEWEILIDFVGGKEIAGKKLKARSGWNEYDNGTDEFGFSALPGGEGGVGGWNLIAGISGRWWSSATEGNSNFAYYRMFFGSGVLRHTDHKKALYSVRCVRD